MGRERQYPAALQELIFYLRVMALPKTITLQHRVSFGNTPKELELPYLFISLYYLYYI